MQSEDRYSLCRRSAKRTSSCRICIILKVLAVKISFLWHFLGRIYNMQIVGFVDLPIQKARRCCVQIWRASFCVSLASESWLCAIPVQFSFVLWKRKLTHLTPSWRRKGENNWHEAFIGTKIKWFPEILETGIRAYKPLPRGSRCLSRPPDPPGVQCNPQSSVHKKHGGSCMRRTFSPIDILSGIDRSFVWKCSKMWNVVNEVKGKKKIEEDNY